MTEVVTAVVAVATSAAVGDTLGMSGRRRVHLPHLAAEFAEGGQAEATQPKLDRARGGEARVGGEAGRQPLGEGLRGAARPAADVAGGGPVMTRKSPGNRPASISSRNWRSASRDFARTSPRTRCRVSTSSSTSSSPGRPQSRRTASGPWRNPRAPKWSRSPRTPAARLAAAATDFCPPSHAISASARPPAQWVPQPHPRSPGTTPPPQRPSVGAAGDSVGLVGGDLRAVRRRPCGR